MDNITGKIVAITGANSGIGKAGAIELAKFGHTILMLCRSKEKGEKVRKEIQKKSGSSNIYLYLVDLASFDDIVRCTSKIRTEWNKIDVLVNNAGVIMLNYSENDLGIEKQFAVNHLGHFLLTDQLLPLLLNAKHPRIIHTSSDAHESAEFGFDDINYENKKYSMLGAYGRSKLANILFVNKLAEKYDPKILSVFSFHPGWIRTNLGQNNGLPARILWLVLLPLSKSPKHGAQPMIYLATKEGLEDVNGHYFVNKQIFPFLKSEVIDIPSDKTSYDQILIDDLWTKSIEIIHNWNRSYEFNFD